MVYAYRREGLDELLVNRVGERGPTELVTQDAFENLEEAMKGGEIFTVAQAHGFFLRKGAHYAHLESVGGLLKRRKVKLRPRAVPAREGRGQRAEGFQKSSPRR